VLNAPSSETGRVHEARVQRGERKPRAMLLKGKHTPELPPREDELELEAPPQRGRRRPEALPPEGERERDAEMQPERGRTQASLVVATPVARKRPAHLGGHSPLGSGRKVTKGNRRSRRGPVRPTKRGSGR
jgi:hypothetical protein